MMDPMTALGLASNIVQLLDFSAKVLSEARKINEASSENPAYAEQVKSMVFRDEEFSQALLKASSAPALQSSEERAIVSSAQACLAQTEELLKLTSGLEVTVRPDGKRSKLKSLRKALKSTRGSKEIQKQTNTLQSSRQQLHLCLSRLILKKQDVGFADVLSETAQTGSDTAAVVSSARDQILQTLETRFSRLDNTTSTVADRLRENDTRSETRHQNIMQHLGNQYLRYETGSARLGQLSQHMREMQIREARERKPKAILDSLNFSQMEARWASIEEAHPATFKWILKDPYSGFRLWLQSPDGLFWIEGKAGSGKSTLMKYLRSHPQTQECLQLWAGEATLITAEHYFWYAGSDLQKTSQGLLQTLLYKTLRADHNLISTACETRWSAPESRLHESWSAAELMEVFHKLGTMTSLSICYFIDGLDEYHPHAHHDKLVATVNQLAGYANMKLCVSSRPWPVFENAWKWIGPKVLLEERTRGDVLQYSRERLLSAANATLSCSPKEVECLCMDICYRAHGVFLWVSFVTDALCERVLAGQGFEQLCTCLESFPKSLKDYFRMHIYDRINSTFESETALALKLDVVCTLSNPRYIEYYSARTDLMSWMIFWLLSQSVKTKGLLLDSEFAFNGSIDHLSYAGRTEMMLETKRFLDACARDFLRIESNPMGMNIPVLFLHRTAFDFLNTKEMQTLLDCHIPEHFRHESFSRCLALALLKLCTSEFESIAAAKAVFYSGGPLRFNGAKRIVDECDRTIAKVYSGRAHDDTALQDSLIWKLPNARASLANDLVYHFDSKHCALSSILEAYPEINNGDPVGTSLPLATALGLDPYYGLFGLEKANFELLQWLLADGARPNTQKLKSFSVEGVIWQLFIRKWIDERWINLEDGTLLLDTKRQSLDVQQTEAIWKLTKLLLNYDADLTSHVCIDEISCYEWDDRERPESCNSVPAIELLRMLLLPHQLSELDEYAQKQLEEPQSR